MALEKREEVSQGRENIRGTGVSPGRLPMRAPREMGRARAAERALEGPGCPPHWARCLLGGVPYHSGPPPSSLIWPEKAFDRYRQAEGKGVGAMGYAPAGLLSLEV